ncbi:MAG: hypothetical protein ACREGA_04025 [Candidatus Saccharimonadales bacterium]
MKVLEISFKNKMRDYENYEHERHQEFLRRLEAKLAEQKSAGKHPDK